MDSNDDSAEQNCLQQCRDTLSARIKIRKTNLKDDRGNIDLAKIPKSHLQEANVRLVVIGCAPHTFIKEFCQETRFPHEFYCDPDRDLHKALGLKSEGSHGKSSPHVKSSVISGVLESTWRAVKSMHYQGDMMQQGGQFIVGPGKKLHYAWRDRTSQDHTSVNQLLAEAGVQQINLPNDPRILQV